MRFNFDNDNEKITYSIRQARSPWPKHHDRTFHKCSWCFTIREAIPLTPHTHARAIVPLINNIGGNWCVAFPDRPIQPRSFISTSCGKKSIGVIFYLKFSVSIFVINYSSVWKMVLNILSFFLPWYSRRCFCVCGVFRKNKKQMFHDRCSATLIFIVFLHW